MLKHLLKIAAVSALIFLYGQQAFCIAPPGAILNNNVQMTYHKSSSTVVLSASTNTTVVTVSGITLVPTRQVSVLLDPGSSYNFAFQLSNFGNIPITVNRVLRSITPSWNVAFYYDINGNGILQSWETVTMDSSMFFGPTPNTKYFIAVVTAPGNSDTTNITGTCVLDFVTTGNTSVGCGGYVGYNGSSYGGSDIVSITLNLSTARIYNVHAKYDVTDNVEITSGNWTNHTTPYFYWDCSSDNAGFSYVLTTNFSIIPDNTVDFSSSTRNFQAPSLNRGTYCFKIKLKDLNGIWGTPNVFTYLLDTDAPNTPTTPNDTGAFTNTSNFQITWPGVNDNGNAGLHHYEVCLGTQPGFSDVTSNVMVTVSAQPAFNFTGINNTAYYCSVRAMDNAGNYSSWSPYSNGIFVDLTPTVNMYCRIVDINNNNNFTLSLSDTWTHDTNPYFYWLATTFNMGYTYSFSPDSSIFPDNAVDTTANFFTTPTLNSEIYYFKLKMLRATLFDGTRIWSPTVSFTYKVDNDIPTPDRAPGLQARYVFANPGKFIFDTITDNYHGSGISQYWVTIWADHGLGKVFDGLAAATGNYFAYSGADGYTYQAQYRLKDAAGNMSMFSPISASMSYLISSDTDHDGIPNLWELANGLDPLDSTDATADYDYDGLNNYAEYAASTNPFTNNRLLLDTDRDGIPDVVELRFGMNPNKASDANDDPDNDKVPSILEYYNGTSPTRSIDSDGDSMPDDWERAYGLNPNIKDGNLDLDGDGVTNYQEYLNGTFPNDKDNDGLPDWWENKYKAAKIGKSIDPENATDAGFAEDYDGDGVPNWLEYRSGTNPLENKDSDGDGLSDDWERIYGFAPYVADSIGDADQDGLSNLTEFLEYTDPLNPNRIPPSAPAVTINNKVMDSGNFTVLTNRNTSMDGIAQPGTIVELWNIVGRNQELLDRKLVGSSGKYRMSFLGHDISASLQILSIDSAGNQRAINKLLLFDDQDPQIASFKIDNAAVIDGDVISPKPKITAQLSYYVMGLDTPNITLTIKSLIVGVSPNTVVYHITGNVLTYADNQLTYIQQTPLPPGLYDIGIFVVDIAGRSITETRSSLNVYGGSSRVVGRPLNYPNPFNPDKESTRICYVLNDNMDITLVLYTDAAEKVWERTLPAGSEGAHGGYNEVFWSGRSDAAEAMGNGVYLFHIVGTSGGKRKVMGKGKILIKR